MATTAPLLLFVRLASTENDALTTSFLGVLQAVKEKRAKLVVLARDAHSNLRNLIVTECANYEVPMFYVPRQSELEKAAQVEVDTEAVAIVVAPRDEPYFKLWLNMLREITGLEGDLGYYPRTN